MSNFKCNVLGVIDEVQAENTVSIIKIQVEQWNKYPPKLAFRIYYKSEGGGYLIGKIASLDKLLLKQCIEDRWIEKALEIIDNYSPPNSIF